MKVCMFGSYVNPSSPDYDQKSEDALKIAKILGAKRIRVWAGNKEPSQAEEELWPFVAGKLREYALQAEDEGIKLAIEMHGGTLCATAEGCERVLAMASAPNLRLNYQVFNPSAPDADRVIGMLGDHVISAHAQNHRPSKLQPDKWEMCLIEEGNVDYDHVLGLLARHGFKGFVEVEFLKGEVDGMDAMLDSLRRDAAYLRQLTAKHTPAE
jgi:sugar phosphate isomerase/epimerase